VCTGSKMKGMKGGNFFHKRLCKKTIGRTKIILSRPLTELV